MPSSNSIRLQPYNVQATTHHTSSASQHSTTSDGRIPASQRRSSSTGGALQHAPRRASDGSGQNGKGAVQPAGQASRLPAPSGAYTSSVTKQAGLLRDPADEAVKASAVAGARQFCSAMLSVSPKPAAAAASSHTSSGAATSPSSSKVRSQSTPRRAGSITAVPGRPRVVQPGSSSSSTANKLAHQGPLTAGMAGQKPVSSTRSCSLTHTTVSPRDSKSGVASSSSHSSSTANSPGYRTHSTAAAATGNYTASAASGRYSISRPSSGSESGFDAAAEAAAAAAEAPPLRSKIALEALLQLKKQRHQQQQQVLERDALGQAEHLTKPASAATAAHLGVLSSSSSFMGTCSRPAGAYASAVAGSGAGAGLTRVGSGSCGGSRTYLDRVSAANTALQHQQVAAAAAAAAAAVGGVTDRAPPRRADGGSARPAAAQLPDTTAASAAAAAIRQRVNIDASPLLRNLSTYGSATASSSVQQHAYAGAPATATAGSEHYNQPQVYRPELYAAAEARISGSSAATATLLHRNRAELQQQLQDRLAKLQLQPGCAPAAGLTDDTQQQQQPQPSQQSTGVERVRERVGISSTASSNISSTRAPASQAATVPPVHSSPRHHATPASIEQTSVAYQHSSGRQQDQLGHAGIGHSHSAAAGVPSSASLAAAPLTAGGHQCAHSGSLGDTQLPPAQAISARPVRAPHPLYTLSPQQAQKVVQPQQQQQHAGGVGSAGSASAYNSYNAAAAAGAQHRTIDNGAAAGTVADLGRRTSSGAGASSAYANLYRPAAQTGSLGASVGSSTTSSYYCAAATPAAAAAAAEKVDAPCAPRYSDSEAGSAGHAAAATAAAMYRSSRYTSAGGSDAARNSCFAGASQQQPYVQQQPQQQQQAASMSRVGSAASSTVLSSRQPSFLIGTHPMSEDVDDARLGVSSDAAAAAGASSHSRGLFSGYSQGEDDATAQQQAALQFLSYKFVASRSSSATVEQGQAVPRQAQQQQVAAAVISKVQSVWAAAQGNVHAGVMYGDAAAASGTAGTKGVVSIPGGGFVEAVEYEASDDSSDVSDVTEMSTSLDHSVASSSSGSDSEDCTAPGISEAVRRRLVGGPRGHGSSISISTEGRSSSCGSGRELETACGAPAATAISSSSGKHAGVSSGSSSRPGQLPQGCMGLNNLGNTCFMNSILQCLNCLPELVTALLGPRVAACIAEDAAAALGFPAAGGVKWGAKASVGPALCELLREMWSPQEGGVAAAAGVVQRPSCAVSPRRFLEAVSSADERWGDGCQQDSQEFLHSLLEQLQSECNRVQGKPQYKELSCHGSLLQQAAEAAAYARSWHDSLVDDLFGGQLQSTITCSACGAQSHCFDPFLDLSVPLPRGKTQVSLQDCLSAFVEQEVLTGSEAVKCGSCKRTCDATKRLQIFQCPRLLLLTLKRFNSGSSSRGGGPGGWAASGSGWFGFSPCSKNQTPVKVDAQHALDLSPYCNQQALLAAVDGAGTGRGCSTPRYQLLAVSEHSGCLGGGHYTAQGRSVADGRWYDFNDASVTPDSHPNGSSSSAYVLFFQLIGDGM